MIERKITRVSHLRALPDGSISGYATTYDPPEDHDAYGDIIAPGAFTASLEGAESLPMLNSHGAPVGVWLDWEDDLTGEHGHAGGGLVVRGRISDTAEGRDVRVLIADGAIKGLSIGFEPLATSELPQQTRWGFPVRRIERGLLLEVSPTAMPANRNAQIIEVRERRLAEHKARAQQVERKGAALVEVLERGIAQQVEDGMARDEVLALMAEAAEVLPSTIDEILSGALSCPEMEKLEGLALALDLSLSELTEAMMLDGCEPGEGERATCPHCGTDKSGAEITQALDSITRSLDAAIHRARALA